MSSIAKVLIFISFSEFVDTSQNLEHQVLLTIILREQVINPGHLVPEPPLLTTDSFNCSIFL